MIVTSNNPKIQKEFQFKIKNQNDILIDNLVKKRAIKTKIVERIMRKIDRKDFCPIDPYDDCQQIIGCEATICAPHLHAYSLEILAPYFKNAKSILDVGSGSGYLTLAFALAMQENIDKKQRILQEKQKCNKILDRLKQPDQQNQQKLNQKEVQKGTKKGFQNENNTDLISNVIIDNQQQKQQQQTYDKKINLSDITDDFDHLIPSIDESSTDKNNDQQQQPKEQQTQSKQDFQQQNSIENDLQLNSNMEIIEKSQNSKIISENKIQSINVIEKNNNKGSYNKIQSINDINKQEKQESKSTQNIKSEYISVGIEHIQELAQHSYTNIQKNYGDFLDDNKVNIAYGDGRKGLSDYAPYDIIYVGASVEKIPQILLDQLNYNGVMLIPVGKPGDQQFYFIEKTNKGKILQTKLMHVIRQPLQSAINQRLTYKYDTQQSQPTNTNR